MGWLRHLRWKLFVSHLLIIVIGVIVLLATAHFLAGSQLGQEAQLSLGQAAAETGQLAPGTPPPNGIATEGGTPTQQEHFQAVVDQALLISAFAALAAAVVVSLFVSRRIVEPLQELSATSQRLARGYYRERTSIRSDDELADLSQSINQL